MADASRLEKLAAARKKLKQFQQQKAAGNTPSNSPATSKSRNSTPANKSKKSKSNSKKEKASKANASTPSPVTDSPAGSTINTTDSIASPTTDRNPSPSPDVSLDSSNPVPERPMSSSESLRQISRQINGLMSEASFLNSSGDQAMEEDSGIRELESRNRELASVLESTMQTNQQVSLQHDELERREHEATMMKEIGALREQLQVHIQTIGILVSEKSELQTTLNQSQMALKQKLEEVDNLGSRLQASRHRVAELERDFASASSASHQYERTSKELDKAHDQLKMDVYNLRRANDDLTQQNSELSSQLQASIAESQTLVHNLQALEEKVTMSELMIQQLSSSGSESQQALQQLEETKSELEKKTAEYQQSFQQLSREREQLTSQYQQDTSHLQQQVQQLATQVKSLIEERDQVLTQHSRLQNKLSIMEESIAAETEKSMQAHQEEMIKRIQEIENEKEQILQQYKAQANDNAQLARLYQEKEEKVEELENTLSRLREESVDKGRLLETLQNDKATISRALAQNKELKIQLAELQNGFVKMSNENMEMASQYQSEQHVSKELAKRLSQQEDELKEVQEQLHSKENLLEQIKAQNFELNKQLAQQAQLTDHMRHYEAQGQLTETLQRELGSAQENINTLSSQNTELRVQLTELQNRLSLQGNEENPSSSVDKGDMVDSLSAAIRQLEMERDQLRYQFEEQREQHRMLLQQMDEIKKEQAQAPAVTPEGNFITKEAYETLQIAMEKLEEKFTKVMRDKADLSDRCQEYEHLCLQLAGETDTIGDYITLYHEQRDRLKERQKEKEEYVRRLANEKEDMQRKLGQLQTLVMQLLGEKKYLHQYSKTTAQQLTQSFADTTVPMSAQTTQNTNRSFGSSSDSTQGEEYEWPSSDTDSSTDSEEGDMERDHVDFGHQANATIPNSSSALPKSKLNKMEVSDGERTAKQIMELIEQMGSPHAIDKKTLLDHAFYPCKCCSGELVNV
ncbi:golgin subfamily A member 2-like isoform X3 [Ptychodera flava]|uniref:golgin subfamily A member 2-like isoform X3 n=1 Tax=Ptychodera flava TaxID=63121 RepID=UPI003969C37D